MSIGGEMHFLMVVVIGNFACRTHASIELPAR